MRVSREQAERNRAHVVEVAGEQFRQHGFDGIGVADLMQAAGLTHGGFYKNFASKEALGAEAMTRALEDNHARVRAAMAGSDDRLAAFARYYLSPGHRDDVAHGCVLVALGADAARLGGAIGAAYAAGVADYVDALVPLMGGDSDAARRAQAASVLALAVGGVTLARSVGPGPLSDSILASTEAQILALGRRSDGA